MNFFASIILKVTIEILFPLYLILYIDPLIITSPSLYLIKV